jgi:hypothetical protein
VGSERVSRYPSRERLAAGEREPLERGATALHSWYRTALARPR